MSKPYRIKVMCGWWERPYVFVVNGNIATHVREPKIQYDTETLRNGAKEKGGYWRKLR